MRINGFTTIAHPDTGEVYVTGTVGCSVIGCRSTGMVRPMEIPEGPFDVVLLFCEAHRKEMAKFNGDDFGRGVAYRPLTLTREAAA